MGFTSHHEFAIFGKRVDIMVKLRLARTGAKKQPFYHIVAADSRNRRDGRYIERLGFFNPVARGRSETLRLNLERVDYWLGCGAQTTGRVAYLIKQMRRAAKAADIPAVAAVPAGNGGSTEADITAVAGSAGNGDPAEQPTAA
jgi:small subunit ribosomal protein S16